MSVNIILSGAKSKSQYLSLCPLSDGRGVILVCDFQTYDLMMLVTIVFQHYH